jgi:uncharacterized membrane protein
MLHHFIQTVLPEIISLFELLGILVILVGGCKTIYNYIWSFFKKQSYNPRLQLGNPLALGLEFKMGAEILKTVLINDLNRCNYCFACVISFSYPLGNSKRKEKSRKT